jgi:hypothetical protein
VPDEQHEVSSGEPVTGPAKQPMPDEPATADAPAVDEAVTDGEDGEDGEDDEDRVDGVVPDEATLSRIATPGVVRRVPKYGAFIGYGAVLGFVLGVVLAFVLDRGDLVNAGEGGGILPFLGGSNGAKLVSGIALAGVGALLGALLALWADARERRR